MKPLFSPRARQRVAGLALAGLLSACAVAPSPPVRLYRLPLHAAGAESVQTRPAERSTRWELRAVRVPDYLDRRSLLVREGDTVLSALDDERWAEPLRVALPRVLRTDLEARLGAGAVLWRADAAARSQATRVLEVEIEQLDADPHQPAAVLSARWQWQARSAPGQGDSPWTPWQSGRWVVPADSAAPVDLVRAQREALAALARRIVENAAP